MELVQPIRDTKKISDIKSRLLDNRECGARNYLLFVLGINSGLRISDLLGLTLRDVMTSNGKAQDSIILHEKKTGKRKQFNVNKAAAKAIQDYAATLKHIDLDMVLFASRKGRDKPITRQHAWQILNDAAEWVGIKDQIGTHSLRKTFGYHAYQAGVPLERLQIIFNHSSQRETLCYIGVTQDDIDDVYNMVNL
jgi:site-specific recombinase XerD